MLFSLLWIQIRMRHRGCQSIGDGLHNFLVLSLHLVHVVFLRILSLKNLITVILLDKNLIIKNLVFETACGTEKPIQRKYDMTA